MSKAKGDSTGVVEYTCEECGGGFVRREKLRGRKPKYCGGMCRNRAYEKRKGIRE